MSAPPSLCPCHLPCLGHSDRIPLVKKTKDTHPFHGKREIGSDRFGWGYGCDFFTPVGGVGVTGTMPAGIGYLEAVRE